jgi:hypothetical protein
MRDIFEDESRTEERAVRVGGTLALLASALLLVSALVKDWKPPVANVEPHAAQHTGETWCEQPR